MGAVGAVLGVRRSYKAYLLLLHLHREEGSYAPQSPVSGQACSLAVKMSVRVRA